MTFVRSVLMQMSFKRKNGNVNTTITFLFSKINRKCFVAYECKQNHEIHFENLIITKWTLLSGLSGCKLLPSNFNQIYNILMLNLHSFIFNLCIFHFFIVFFIFGHTAFFVFLQATFGSIACCCVSCFATFFIRKRFVNIWASSQFSFTILLSDG